MGEGGRDLEQLTPGERDRYLGDYNASEDVSAAHEIVLDAFSRAEAADQVAAERADFRETIDAKFRHLFWLSSEIDKLIEQRPDEDRLALRQRKTRELTVLANMKEVIEKDPRNLEEVEHRLQQAEDALAGMMKELSQTETGPDTQFGSQ